MKGNITAGCFNYSMWYHKYLVKNENILIIGKTDIWRKDKKQNTVAVGCCRNEVASRIMNCILLSRKWNENLWIPSSFSRLY